MTLASHSSFPLPQPETRLLDFPLTDSGQGERIIALFGCDLRYCAELKSWFVWDGRRWEKDWRGVMMQLAKQTSRRLYAEAAESACVSVYAVRSEDQARVVAALKWAAIEPGIPVRKADLDARPELVNYPSGVLDLRTRELLPHDRSYLLTKISAVDYDPLAKMPAWDERGHDPSVRQFLSDCCVKGDGLWVRVSVLSAEYLKFCKRERIRFLGRSEFVRAIRGEGFRYKRSRHIDGRQARTWEGVALRIVPGDLTRP